MMFTCPGCRRTYESVTLCACGSPLLLEDETKKSVKFEGSGVWRYQDLLPVPKKISLNEGGTPVQQFADLDLFIKDETRNPTGSFRDRAATLILSHARNTKLACGSNGNLGASIAAYAAFAGSESYLFVPKYVERGKLLQMMMYNAHVIRIGETADDLIDPVQEACRLNNFYDASEYNPLAIEGQKTLAFEIFEDGQFDNLIIPVGNGGTLFSLYRGFFQLKELGYTEKIPKIIGVQSENCAPLVGGSPRETRALAIYVKKPLFGDLALTAVKNTNGRFVTVSEREILGAQKLLAEKGIFCELASATTVAAGIRYDFQGKTLCIITGSGLKSFDIKKDYFGVTSTKVEILRMLQEKESYGYEIWKNLGKKMKIQAVYQHLNGLKEKDMIRPNKVGRKVYYTITEKGKRFLEVYTEIL
jgi:threonine synthase